MSNIFQNLHRQQNIPLSTSTSDSYSKTGAQGAAIRRRLSSFSFSASTGGGSGATSWAFPRSKSVEYAGNALRDWWNWGLGLILCKKPDFAKDLEMNEEETAVLGYHNKGSWWHVFYKVKKEIRKLIGSTDNVSLPQTFKSYSNI